MYKVNTKQANSLLLATHSKPLLYVESIIPLNPLIMKTLPQVALPDGKVATSFVPELTGELAIVHLSVLQRITARLNKAAFVSIRAQFMEDIEKSNDLKEMVEIAEEEVAFHRSVNLIQQYTEDMKTTTAPISVAGEAVPD